MLVYKTLSFSLKRNRYIKKTTLLHQDDALHQYCFQTLTAKKVRKIKKFFSWSLPFSFNKSNILGKFCGVWLEHVGGHDDNSAAESSIFVYTHQHTHMLFVLYSHMGSL